MYGIFTYVYHKFKPNVGKYPIRGSYGMERFKSTSNSKVWRGKSRHVRHESEFNPGEPRGKNIQKSPFLLRNRPKGPKSLYNFDGIPL